MDKQRSSDIDLFTLAIAAVAAAAAAFITSQVWTGGTLFTAALTPVIVALVKEALARPVDAVQSVRTERRTREHPQIIDPTDPDEPYVTVYGRGTSSRRWKVAIVSGLAAFALVVALFTLPELVAGKSIGRSGDGAKTTFFGGKAGKKTSSSKQKDATRQTTSPSKTAAPEDTPTAAPTEAATDAPTPEATETAAPTEAPTAAPTTAP